jgi:hypothetical protein
MQAGDGGHLAEVVGLARDGTSLHDGGREDAACYIGGGVPSLPRFGYGDQCGR